MSASTASESAILAQIVTIGAIRQIVGRGPAEPWRDSSPWSTSYLARELTSVAHVRAFDSADVKIERYESVVDLFDMHLHRERLQWMPLIRLIANGRDIRLDPSEIISQAVPIKAARGRVGVAGVRLGYAVARMLSKPDVEQLVVYEQNQALVDLYARNFGTDARLSFSDQNLSTLSGETFDAFYDGSSNGMLERSAFMRWRDLTLKNAVGYYHMRGVAGLHVPILDKESTFNKLSSGWKALVNVVDPKLSERKMFPIDKEFLERWIPAGAAWRRGAEVQVDREIISRLRYRRWWSWSDGHAQLIPPTERPQLQWGATGELREGPYGCVLGPGVCADMLQLAVDNSGGTLDAGGLRLNLERWQPSGIGGQAAPRGSVHWSIERDTDGPVGVSSAYETKLDGLSGGSERFTAQRTYRRSLVVYSVDLGAHVFGNLVQHLVDAPALELAIDELVWGILQGDGADRLTEFLSVHGGDVSAVDSIMHVAAECRDWPELVSVVADNIVHSGLRRVGFDAVIGISMHDEWPGTFGVWWPRGLQIREVADLSTPMFPSERGPVWRPPAYEFDRYRMAAMLFHSPDGIHGLAHAARVLVRANQVAEAMMADGVCVDLEVVRWSAVVHDVGRHNDGIDPEHGRRSASWFTANVNWIAPHLSAEQREKVAYCCTWHVPDDDQAPEMTSELVALKDADGLDRLRFDGLDPKFLRTQCARGLVESARELVTASRMFQSDLMDGWDVVRAAVLRRQEWK